MSEETKERGLLGDLFVLAIIIGLALAAIYFTGNWPWLLKTIANLEVEIRDFVNIFTTNIKSVVDVAQSAPQIP